MRVLLVEESRAVMQAMRTSLLQAGFTEVQATADAEAALSLAAAWQPDAVVVEVKRRDGKGVGLCRALRKQAPGALILVVTSWADPLEHLDVIQAGIDGYLLKEADAGELIRRLHITRRCTHEK